MHIVYDGVDITEAVSLQKAVIMDRVCGKLDCIEILANNPVNEWSGWNPKKEDRIVLKQDGFTSGEMYVYSVKQHLGGINFVAVPIKQISKEPHTQSWENVTLFELLGEFARRHSLELKTYNVTNHRYHRINQIGQADFSFLNQRCVLEGYGLKITDHNLVIFDERFMENQSPVIVHKTDCLGDFNFHDKAHNVYGSCMIQGTYFYTFHDPNTKGPVLVLDSIQASSIGEAERFAKNSLRNFNKYEYTLQISTKLNLGLAAGIPVQLQGFGLADHIYFIDELQHSLLEDRTSLGLRKIVRW